MVSFPQVSPPEPCAPLSHPPHATCPTHLILLDFTTCTIFSKEYRSLSSSSCNFLHSPVTSTLLGPNTVLNILFSNTLSLRSSLNISDQVSHPYRTTGNIIIVLVLQTWNIYALLTWMKVKLLRWRRQTSHSASPYSLNNPIISNWKLHMFFFSRMLFSKTLFPADTNIPLVPVQICT